jgi:hypothetical protein
MSNVVSPTPYCIRMSFFYREGTMKAVQLGFLIAIIVLLLQIRMDHCNALQTTSASRHGLYNFCQFS